MTHKIGLIGAGLMGTGLARLFRRSDWSVAVCDLDRAATERLTREVPGVRITVNLADVAEGADLVIEAASELAAVKQAIFAELAEVASCASASPTSSTCWHPA